MPLLDPRGVPIERIDVLYCEGWDPVARAAVGPLSARLASGRHQAGEQYAVLLSAGGRRVGLIEVAAGDLYVGAWFMDGEFRRVSEVDCRVLAPGRLFTVSQRTGPQEDAEPSDHPSDRWLHVVDALPEGIIDESRTFPDGTMSAGARQADVGDHWIGVPDFGDWGTFIQSFPEALQAAGLDVPGPVVVRDVSPGDGTGLPPGERPWRARRGLAPDPAYLAWLFTAGTRLAFHARGWLGEDPETVKKVTVEVRDAGTLHMPSGQLTAADPGWIRADGEPFTVTVPPGSYPVQLSVVRFDDNPEHRRVAAARLAVRDIPVESWEMALTAGQDPRALPDRGFYGFNVDAGMGCFYDASAAASFAHQPRGWLGQFDLRRLAFTAVASDPGSSANLIAYHSGWGDGSYPVWIGRSADREVACFVADMQLMPDDVAVDED